MEQTHSYASLTIGLVLGALAGLAIGLLMAPKRGSETRSLVKDAIAGGLDKLQGLEAGEGRQVK